MTWRLRRLGALATVALLAACTMQAPASDPVPLSPGESLGELRARARAALARYDAAVAAGQKADPIDITQSWDPSRSLAGISVRSVRATTVDTQLTVTFIGAERPATEPCGADYAAEPAESATAVVIIVIAQRHATNELCTLMGFTRTATLNLARPLGDRAVLDLQQWHRIPVTTAPGRK